MDPATGLPLTPSRPKPRIIDRLRIPGVVILSLAAAGSATRLIPAPVHWPAWTAGWMAAILNAAAGAFLHHRAIGRDIDRFLRWGLAGNSLRMVALFCSVCAFCYSTEGSVRRSFLVAFFGGVLVLTGAEMVTLLKTIFESDASKSKMNRQTDITN